MSRENSVIVDEVRRRAREISKRHNDDVRAYVQHLKRVQQRYAERLVSQITVVPETRPKETSP